MQLTSHLSSSARQPLSRWLWPLAFVFGILLAAASLGYSPDGRINLLWVWLIWAGLPLLGSFISLWVIFLGKRRPWLFQWGVVNIHWRPSPGQRLDMLAALQGFWCLVALGMLAGFWSLLLFTDLAFGWSSTLIDKPSVIHHVTQLIAYPWRVLWPAAVPDPLLIDSTRYLRIAPGHDDLDQAGGWWRFLMASLICYNFLPRALLYALTTLARKRLESSGLEVRGSSEIPVTSSGPVKLSEDSLTQWQSAQVIYWEAKPDVTSGSISLGLADWRGDEQVMEQLLKQAPASILWRVNANRSPVAELSDLMEMARKAGVQAQALLAIKDDTTDPGRHISSWRSFAEKQQLVWLKDSQ